MPLYEYHCTACGRRLEVLQRFGAAPLVQCPHCGGSLTKLPSVPALKFKGSGFYLTDYGRAGAKKAEGEIRKSEGAGDKAPASTDGKPAADSKPAVDSKPAADSKPGAAPKHAADSKPAANKAAS